MLRVCSDCAPSMVAPATRTTDTVACRIEQSFAREGGAVRWCRGREPRSASAGSVRVANQAGAAPKMIPVISANPKAKARTGERGHGADGKEIGAAECQRAVASARRPWRRASPAMPPAMASRMLSVRACVMICRRVAPMARRTAVCPRRATAASQKQVGDIGAGDQQHQAANGKQNLQAAAVLFFHDGDAGTGGHDVDDLLGKVADYVGHPVGGIAGVVLHPCRSTPVRRGAIPSMEAPGRRRPITRSQAEIDWCSRVPSPSIIGSCCNGNPDIGRIAVQGFAEKSGGRDTDHGEGMALDDRRSSRRSNGLNRRWFARHDG